MLYNNWQAFEKDEGPVPAPEIAFFAEYSEAEAAIDICKRKRRR